jgi:hypothetical protein
MKFFTGLLIGLWITVLFWSVHQWGYARGSEAESHYRNVANNRLQDCQLVLAGGRK